jgi:hypothetical protein
MSDFINKLLNGDLDGFRQQIFDTLYQKAGESFEERKTEIANNLYSSNDEVEELEPAEEE